MLRPDEEDTSPYEKMKYCQERGQLVCKQCWCGVGMKWLWFEGWLA